MRTVHVYFDGGGMFGTPTIHLSEQKLAVPGEQDDGGSISNYYFGQLTGMAVRTLIHAHFAAYPGYPIYNLEGALVFGKDTAIQNLPLLASLN